MSQAITVKLTTSSPEWPFVRQTPSRSGRWGRCEFKINAQTAEADWWVVFGDLPEEEETVCRAGQTLIITGEPPTVKSYDAGFVGQFGYVISCQTLEHPRLTKIQQGFPWMVGCRFDATRGKWENEYSKDYDELASIGPPLKTKLLSVICSNKTMTETHLQRLRFLDRLREQFGQEIDVFGVGIGDIPDKWDAIAPYRYHIVLENYVLEHYWTEKLSDAFLGDSYPLYYGCPNIADYFPRGCLTPIDIHDMMGATSVIRAAIEEDRYGKTAQERSAAKGLVLNQYNLFALIADHVQRFDEPVARRHSVRLRPHRTFERRFARKAKERLKKLAAGLRR